MMKNIFGLILIITALAFQPASAKDGGRFAFEIYQRDSAGQPVLLLEDTTRLLVGVRSHGFFTGFSVEVELTEVDTARAAFTVQLVTLSERPLNLARTFQVEYGLPARIDDISVKNSTSYSLVIRPLERLEIETEGCTYAHYNRDDFDFDPTAYTDLYFVKNTYGDYYWNSIKTLMEDRYRFFRDLNKFNLPGKYSVFLCPCPIFSVIWDTRFGMMVDPTRRNAFAIFSKNFNSVDPFLVLQLSILHNYGYAPVFLTEGFANYLSFANYDMKKLFAVGKNEPVAALLNTLTYYRAEPRLADCTSASFVRFLINQYKIDVFLDMYRKADDLNLRKVMEETYGKPVSVLEKEWRHYVDTVMITPQQLSFYGEQAELLFQYETMLEYYEELIKVVATPVDSVAALGKLVRACFFTGDYYRATEEQEKITQRDSAAAIDWMALGTYQMMNGYYDSAYTNLSRAYEKDTLDNIIRFNLGLNYLCRGDTARARDFFLNVINSPVDGSAQPEARVMLGNIFLHSGSMSDREAAERLFTEVVKIEQQILNSNSVSSANHLWMGAAYIGLGDLGNAYEHLHVARYLETRPFYLGMIHLWLGKAADLNGDHEAARDHYGQVLALSSADYTQKEARKYLEHPYTQ
ncbi:MAG: tetratricopeptide repeat protein [Candidatus Zixiibacteriota bacterium]